MKSKFRFCISIFAYALCFVRFLRIFEFSQVENKFEIFVRYRHFFSLRSVFTRNPPKRTDLSYFMLPDTWQHSLLYYSNIQIICSTRCHRIFTRFFKSKFAFWGAGRTDFVTNTSMTIFIMRLFLYHKLQDRFFFKNENKIDMSIVFEIQINLKWQIVLTSPDSFYCSRFHPSDKLLRKFTYAAFCYNEHGNELIFSNCILLIWEIQL